MASSTSNTVLVVDSVGINTSSSEYAQASTASGHGWWANVDDLTSNARKIMGLHGASGKPLIARYIARNLTMQDPPVIPASIQSILNKAVVVNWEKSCLFEDQAEKLE